MTFFTREEQAKKFKENKVKAYIFFPTSFYVVFWLVLWKNY